MGIPQFATTAPVPVDFDAWEYEVQVTDAGEFVGPDQAAQYVLLFADAANVGPVTLINPTGVPLDLDGPEIQPDDVTGLYIDNVQRFRVRGTAGDLLRVVVLV